MITLSTLRGTNTGPPFLRRHVHVMFPVESLLSKEKN